MSMAAVDQHMHLAKQLTTKQVEVFMKTKLSKIYMPQSTYGIQSKTIKQ